MKIPRDVAMIVPVLGDHEALVSLSAAIDAFESAPAEVVVVNGREDADVTALCAQRGYRLVEANANRGAQLDRGARESHAPVLWFVHASAKLGPRALCAVSEACTGRTESGALTFRFQGEPDPLKTAIEKLVALRIRLGGMVYGDQAIFATRRAYLESGGFSHEPLFEEVALVKRLRGRATFAVLDEPVHVSTRRWERDGWLKRCLHNRWLALGYALGVPVEELNSAYRNRPEPRGESGS
jgi:hypothetical protein